MNTPNELEAKSNDDDDNGDFIVALEDDDDVEFVDNKDEDDWIVVTHDFSMDIVLSMQIIALLVMLYLLRVVTATYACLALAPHSLRP